MKAIFKLFVAANIALYRLTAGRLGGKIRGLPILLLTTIGRKTGKARTVPLVFIEDGANLVIAASMGGQPAHPVWFRNLETNPDVTVELPRRRFKARAEVTRPEERARLWTKLNEVAPFFQNEYQVKTKRVIPVVVLRPAG